MEVQPGAEAGLCVVADGMGGSNAGEVASELAVRTVFDVLKPALSAGGGGCGVRATAEDTPELLAGAVLAANRAVYRAGQEDPLRAGMGTTLTAALVLDGMLNVAHVGDSRALLVRRGTWQQVTTDHSLVAELVRRGGLTEGEAMVHPQRNVLTRALGTEAEVAVDLLQDPLEPGDTVVLCTDGVTKYLTNREITRLATHGRKIDEGAEMIVELANSRGGSDNLTVVLIRFSAEADCRGA